MITLFAADADVDGLGSPRLIIMVVGPVGTEDILPDRGERCAGLLLLVQLRCTLLALGLCSCMVSAFRVVGVLWVGILFDVRD